MKSLFKTHPHWAVAIVASLFVGLYWSLWASDRYVSHAIVVLESPQISQPELSMASLFGGSSGNQDLLLLREHLLSVDMLRHVQDTLDFRSHYSQHGDLVSRLRNPQAPMEDLHRYYQKRIKIDLDGYTNVLHIRVQAYTPVFAHQLAQRLLSAGERHMNQMGHRLAEEQVRFLEGQLERLGQRLDHAREALLAYQNEHGLVSPLHTVESINQVIATLEGEVAKLQAQRQALTSFHSPESAEIRRLQSEITALKAQIDHQRERLAQTAGDALNRITSDYQSLELQLRFAQETYSSALAALESTRIEAARQLKQVSILQTPTLPEFATEPRRLFNFSVFVLITILIAFIASMILMIIRDHQD